MRFENCSALRGGVSVPLRKRSAFTRSRPPAMARAAGEAGARRGGAPRGQASPRAPGFAIEEELVAGTGDDSSRAQTAALGAATGFHSALLLPVGPLARSQDQNKGARGSSVVCHHCPLRSAAQSSRNESASVVDRTHAGGLCQQRAVGVGPTAEAGRRVSLRAPRRRRRRRGGSRCVADVRLPARVV